MFLWRHCLGVSETEELLIKSDLIEARSCRLLVLLLLGHLLGGQDLVAGGDVTRDRTFNDSVRN